MKLIIEILNVFIVNLFKCCHNLSFAIFQFDYSTPLYDYLIYYFSICFDILKLGMFWQVVCNSKKISVKILNDISCTFGAYFFCCIWSNALNNSFIYNCTCHAWPFFRKTEKMSWTKHVSHAIAWCGFFKSTRVRLQKYLDYSTSTNKKVYITTSSSSLLLLSFLFSY